MIIDFASLSAAECYGWMTQAVVPRPVAWILSENDGGDYNLAPFSYFNALSSAPCGAAIRKYFNQYPPPRKVCWHIAPMMHAANPN